jgi:methionyl-tRNA formyltransferase
MTPLRLIFMGTAPLAAASLEKLLPWPQGHLLAVVTQPDRPKGRDLKPQPSPVKLVAQRVGLPLLQPEKAKAPAFLEQLRELQPDLIVVAAYGQILPPALLDLPRYRCLNVHASLLPKYRGAAPIQWCLLNGDADTGVTIMLMEPSLDTGPILTQEVVPIAATDTAATLHDRLAAVGAELLLRTIPAYVAGDILPRPQPAEGVSYARKIVKEDGSLDWSQPAALLANRVRGLTPWPGTSTLLEGAPAPLLVKIWDARAELGAGGQPGEILRADKEGVLAACGEGALRVLTLQREGGRRLSAQQFLAGHPLQQGQRFLPLTPGRSA